MPKIRNIIIFVAIAAVFVLIYVFVINKNKAPDQGSLVSSNPTLPNVNGSLPDANATAGTSPDVQVFLTQLLNVNNITLIDGIFSDPAFNSLHDSSIILVQDGTEGRPNPFAQFGNDSAPLSPTNTPITTPVPAKP